MFAGGAGMTAHILPDPQKFGRDLGVMNMAGALPQGLGAACAVALLSVGFSLSSVFAAASGAALFASAILMLMRRVPWSGQFMAVGNPASPPATLGFLGGACPGARAPSGQDQTPGPRARENGRRGTGRPGRS